MLGRAVIAAGGRGTKLRPLSRVVPKELFPIGRQPIIERIVEELAGAGIAEILVVLTPEKEVIRQYLGDGSTWNVHIDYAYQPDSLGPADAILRAESWTAGEPFALAFSDNLIEPAPGDHRSAPLLRLIAHRPEAGVAVLVEQVPSTALDREHTVFASLDRPVRPTTTSFLHRASDHAVRPESGEVTVVCAARWVLSASIFPHLRRVSPREDGESYLIDCVPDYLAETGPITVVPLLAGEHRHNLDVWSRYLSRAGREALEAPESTRDLGRESVTAE